MDISRVSKLGFGTSQIGGPSLIGGEMTGAKPIPKRAALDIMKYAQEHGINFFDTSDKYGNAEELLGEAFSKKRDQVVIATKCGLTDRGGRNFSIPYVRTCVENSLRRLDSEYIDIFQLAKPPVAQVSDELLLFFEKAIREGKIRYFGISVIGNDDEQAYIPQKTISSFQIFYNLLFVENAALITACAQHRKFVIVRSPLNSGILSGSYSMDTTFSPADSRSKIFHGQLLQERLICVEKLKNRFGLSRDALLPFALNFIFSNPHVNVVIPAASKIEQLREYIRVFNEEKRFSPQELETIVGYVRNELRLERSSQLP